MNEYQVAFEVAGPAAMFTRPDTGSTPISYPVPTFSAAKGMFEAVLWRPHVYVHPTWVEICKPIRFERYVTNYGGPLRKGKDIREGNSYQFMATILADVCYRIHGEVRMKKMSTRGSIITKRQIAEAGLDAENIFLKMIEKKWVKQVGKTKYRPNGKLEDFKQDIQAEFGKEFQKIWFVLKNPIGRTQLRHRRGKDWQPRFKKKFDEQLTNGQTFYTPCLGWKEFVPTYFGPFRDHDERSQKIERVKTGEIHIPAMLTSMWDNRQYKPCFRERWIVDGLLSYEHERPPKEVLNVE